MRLTRNLKLRISDGITQDALYNLEKLDTLGETFSIDSTGQSVVRSQEGISFRPNDNSVGGSGSGGEVSFGTLSQRLSQLLINGPLSLRDSAGSSLLKIKYDSTLSGTVDSTDRLLEIDMNGADRELILGANLSLSGSPLSLSMPAPLSLTLPSGVGTPNQVLVTDGAGVLSWATAGSGTVTSVDLSLPLFTISGNPVTTSGTLTGVLTNQAANQVLAGPASGPAAAPSFRQLSTSDLTEGSSLFFTDTRARNAAVLDSMSGSQTDQAPSVSSVKSYVASSVPNVAQAQVIHVNKNQPGSYTADGSLNKPFKTVKEALDSISDASAVKKYALLIAPGDYVENSLIRLKGWIDLISLANDTVSISTSDSSRLKWSNNSPGRVFITRIGLPNGIEVLNDVPLGTSGVVLDLDNSDVNSIVFNGRGGGRDYIQLRNDTRVNGTTLIHSAATTIFDSTLIGLLSMTDTGCVAPDVYGSAITATLRSNYELSVNITTGTYDIYVDAWGNNPISSLTITSGSAVPCTFNADASSYPNSISLSGSPTPVVNRTSPSEAISFSPGTPANWTLPVPDVKTALDQLAAKSSLTVSSTSGLQLIGSALSVDPAKATLKSGANSADVLLIADSASSYSLKKILVSDITNLSGGAYATTWSSGTSTVITHGLNSLDVMVQVFDLATGETVSIDQEVRTDVNNVTLTASSAPTGAGRRVLIKRI